MRRQSYLFHGEGHPHPQAVVDHHLPLVPLDQVADEHVVSVFSLIVPFAFAELLIDCEEDRTLRAVLVGMLREADKRSP